MKTITAALASGVSLIALCAPLAFADAQSIAIQSLSPGSTVNPYGTVSFTASVTGFMPQGFRVTDSFAGSSLKSNDINLLGQFVWQTMPADLGTHTLTIVASDSNGDMATTTQTVDVTPAPAISITAVSPGTAINPGTKLTFTVATPGFTDPSFIVGDMFSGSTVGDTNIDPYGNFSWIPDVSQDGAHTITVYATDAKGHSSTASENIQVGPTASLQLQSISPGTSVSPGATLTFNVSATAFLPSSYGVQDSFSGTTLSNGDITSTGVFSWTPQVSDEGTHLLTITGSVGPYGQSASTTQTIIVLGAGGTPAIAATQSATTTPAPANVRMNMTASVTPNVNPKIACVGTAVLAREQSIDAAMTTFTGAENAAYTARDAALQQAYTLASVAAIKTADKSAWATFNASMKSARLAWQKARNTAWTKYRAIAVPCNAPSGTGDGIYSGNELSGS